MHDGRINILLIEDSPTQSKVIEEMFRDIPDTPFILAHADSLEKGLALLKTAAFDSILLDLTLPDSMGLDTFLSVHEAKPEMPVVVLSGSDDETLALKAVQEGAQDYLVKGQVSRVLLARSIRYAIERQELQLKLQRMALTDDLTGLSNRRAFFLFAQQQLKMVERRHQDGFLLVLADLDGLKKINDTYGHQEGDVALFEIGHVLKQTFREQDIIARFGGDEFAVLALQATDQDEAIIRQRLQDHLCQKNGKGRHPYLLSLSAGMAYCDPRRPASIDELLVHADQRMYQEKKAKRG